MRILTFCQYYYPENFQITPICEQLAADGHDVTVVTGLPNYPEGVVPKYYKKGHRDEVLNGVRVIRCHEIGRKTGVLRLALNYVSYVHSASSMVENLSDDYDIIFVYQLSPVLMALPALKYKKKHDIPLFLYCCDIWPESMKVYVHSEKNIAFKWAKRISKKIYMSADKIACQSTSFLPYLTTTHDIASDKMLYIPAFADETYLTQDFTPEDDVVDFVFLGNLGIAQNLLAVLQAIEKIKETPGFKVHFVGDGSMLSEMKSFVKKCKLDKVVSFYGRRSVEEMPKFYKLADACLVSLKADTQIGLTLPAKVQGYMAAGKPIIGMIDGSAQEAIIESGCGICVRANDVDALAAGMKDFIEHRGKYNDCGNKAREYFKNNFKKSIFIRKLEEEFERLVKR